MEYPLGESGAARQYYAPETKIRRRRYNRFASVTPQSLTEEVGFRLIAGGVRDRLISDVPVGILCSGGLDRV